jgi:hypothetical protein
MGRFTRQSAAAKWARLALKCGLLLTDSKTWETVADQVRDRADDVGDEVKRRYEDQAERLHEAGRALRGRNHWVAPTMNFLGGIGLGIGLGVLFAPTSGEETRTALREKVVNIKNKVGDMAAGLDRGSIRSSATGTDGV